MFLQGEFLDTVIGIPDSCSEIAVLRAPDGGGGVRGPEGILVSLSERIG